ncbi:MAG: hypothetical protein SFU99_08580 [Saprospiraceae bacterium]|nr:hypothetical protein [Saprospiraceae bacterium]
MKPIFIVLMLLCFGAMLSAQDLHIYYDLQTQTARYFIDSQEVTRPYVRKGSSVVMHIENYNNYLYDVVIESENREIRLPSSASPNSLTQLFPTLGENSINFLSLTSGSRGGNSLGLIGKEDDKGTAPREFDASLGVGRQEYEQLVKLTESFSKSMAEIEQIDVAIDSTRQEVQSIVEAHQINAFVMEEIEQIKHHPGLPPAQIKKMTRDYMNKVLGVNTDASDVDLNFLLQKGNTRRQLSNKLSEVREQHDQYRQVIARMNTIQESLNAFSAKPVVNSLFVQPVAASYENAESQENEYSDFENKLVNLISEMPDADITKLAALWREYEALQANTFTKNHRVAADGDDMVFNIRFSPNNAQEGAAALPALQLSPIQIPVAGGFKVNASIGVAFGQFFEQPQSYFVRNDIIRSEDKDSFFPVISSFFHFYGQSKGNISFGGAFGIGLPVTGDNAGQSASFFLGPSLIIGRGERLVLNTGLMGARVERLAQGYKVGDTFISDANVVPTKDVYEMGFFTGLSFNLVGSNR